VVSIKKNEKYDAKKLATHLLDNALYTAFAPTDKPRIAIAVVVENGGWGATAAAPVVRKALDYYLLGKKAGDKATAADKSDEAAAAAVPANNLRD